MQGSVYARFCNHWVALIGVSSAKNIQCLLKAVPEIFNIQFIFNFYVFVFLQALCSFMIMFVIQWMYALINIIVALILFLYIGTASPGLPTGNCT